MAVEVASGAVVYQMRSGKPFYLLLQSATSDFWGFPKGHVEGQESLVDTAKREIHEETKLTVAVDTTFQSETQYQMKNGNLKKMTLFVSEVPVGVSVERQVAEISASGWFDYATARNRLSYENLRAMLDEANEYILHH